MVMASGCADYEPGVKAIEDLAPSMKKHQKNCLMMPKGFGEEANTYGDALGKLPSRYLDSFKDDAKALQEKFGDRLDEPCDTVIKGAKLCKADGAPNISGNGQSVIDICKAVKGIDGKL